MMMVANIEKGERKRHNDKRSGPRKGRRDKKTHIELGIGYVCTRAVAAMAISSTGESTWRLS
jgi:hypothetical protein